MAINIQHTYTTHVEITFDQRFRYCTCGSMDEIAETVCKILVKNNFISADVCSAETGELLMIIERT